MKKRKRQSYTVILIPDDNGRTFSFRFHRFLLYIVLFLFILFSTCVFFLIYRSGKIGAKLQLTHTLIEENEFLRKENSKIKSIQEKIQAINETSSYIQRISSAIGETDREMPIAKTTISEKEKIFTDDSLDTFIEKVRHNESKIYQQLDVSSVSREELVASIPNISPAEGWLTKKFSHKNQSIDYHLGVDFAAQSGSLIRSTAPGIVAAVINDTYFGLMVVIDHKFGFTTRYGHCMKILVSKGDTVKRGQTIALMGNTGLSSAPHVHYEIIKDLKHVDPMHYLHDRFDE